MNHFITFSVNNKGTLRLLQSEHDGPVIISSSNHPDKDIQLNAGEMVMLVNLYRYIKENDIQNDFINPNGKEKAL